MKFLFATAAVIIAAVVYSPVSSQVLCNVYCPQYVNGTCINGNIPNPEDCGSFCTCAECVPYRMYCPPGTHYSPVIDACINIEQSDCIASTVQPITDAPTTPPPTTELVSFAVNLYEREFTQDPMVFDVTILNRGNHMNEATSRTTIPRTGYYMFTMSVGSSPGTGLLYYLVQDGWYRTSIYRLSSTPLGHDTSGRDVIAYFSAGSQLWIASQANKVYSTSNGFLTSYGVADLSAAVGGGPLFSVSRSNSFPVGQVLFEHVHANQGGGWHSINNHFVVPSSGVYFFSWSLGVNTRTRANCDLVVNSISLADIYRLSTSHNNVDTLGRAAMYNLFAGDVVDLRSGFSGLSSEYQQTSFAGFRYQPTHGNAVAWAVYRNSNVTSGMDPLFFNDVQVNVGGAWRNHEVVCPYSGYYYVHLGAGALPHTPVDITLMNNGVPEGKLSRDDITHNDVDTLSRSMYIYCNQNDRLKVTVAPGTGLYSDNSVQTSFLGFFLHS